jgi:predicted nucleic acid-binding protein
MPPNFFDKIIISDTSCLIALTNIGRLDILRDVCQNILVTPEIAAEYGEELPAWITVVPVRDQEKVSLIQRTLDIGESSAIALALETKEPLLILDDAPARSFAMDIGLSITGTLGILIAAYQQGIITDIDSIISKLRSNGFRLPRNLLFK